MLIELNNNDEKGLTWQLNFTFIDQEQKEFNLQIKNVIHNRRIRPAARKSELIIAVRDDW